jgi:hypothetical protein
VPERTTRRLHEDGVVSTYDVSPGAVRPLLSMYWTSDGWREPPVIPVDRDFESAVQAGVMFREIPVRRHDEWVSAVRLAAADLRPEDVGASFVTSLASRRLDLRSALGSFAIARHLPDHEYAPGEQHRCGVCGLASEEDQDRNILNFERFKWGGVRRDDLTYIALDLDLFARAPRLHLSSGDISTGRALLTALVTAAPGDTAVKAAASLTLVKGNKAEREALVEILSVCGVLESREHPGYRTGFVRYDRRESTGAHYEDHFYPMPWWRGRDGISAEAVHEWFPFLA